MLPVKAGSIIGLGVMSLSYLKHKKPRLGGTLNRGAQLKPCPSF
jgi:hypothetical protein